MPSLGADMEKGTVVEWLKKPGDRIAKGDVVAVVETQKGSFEVEVFEDGVLSEIVVAVGTEVPVGAVLARIDSGEVATVPASAPPQAVMPSMPAFKPAVVPPPRPAGERLRLSPAAARRAAELGVDPRGVVGSGQGGAITLADVEAAVAKTARAAGGKTRRGFDPAAMRQAIAGAMARSKREIPHYYLGLPIDMDRALKWLAAENARRDIENRLLVGVLLLKATALALKDVPELNGFWIDGEPRLSSAVHVGWAISLRGGGLMAPAIHDADGKTVDQLMAALRDLVVRARTARLRGSEMTDPTVTITSLGERGAERVYGVIYPPQLAIVGFGAVRPAPAVLDGAVAVRPTVYATVSGDHRASDGVSGSRLLVAIDSRLQAPEAL
ncbi:MAG: 2-oxo acid dehydrogenase subunit E2 [Reyranella sp.]|nr:2-oxo acid dehydrogenase subunit E2 [Reyranella sp.]